MLIKVQSKFIETNMVSSVSRDRQLIIINMTDGSQITLLARSNVVSEVENLANKVNAANAVKGVVGDVIVFDAATGLRLVEPDRDISPEVAKKIVRDLDILPGSGGAVGGVLVDENNKPRIPNLGPLNAFNALSAIPGALR